MKYLLHFLLLLSLVQNVNAMENNTRVFPVSVQEGPFLQDWDSAEGLLRLERSEAKANFWKLLRFYECQTRLTYCGVAGAVMALNALGVQAPASAVLGPFRLFTQEEFFSSDVAAVIDPQKVIKEGLALRDMETVLNTFPIDLSTYPATSLSEEAIRTEIISALQDPQKCVLALYQRRVMGQVGGGHWSPIAAYDAQSDSFLILDVCKFKYPPTWVDASLLIQAMQTVNMHGASRGFVILGSDKLK